MTMTDFVAKWNGKYIDFDGVYGNQCMDLMHQWITEGFGITNGAVLAAPSAKDVYNNFDNLFGHESFEKIANTPAGVPQEGDIVLWSSGLYGHVAIFIDGDVNNFNSFDQNWPSGSPSHVQSHNYTGVLGWLRFKGENVYQVGHEVIQNSDNWIAMLQKYLFPNNKDMVFAELDKWQSLEDKFLAQSNELENYKQQAQTEIASLKNDVNVLTTENTGLKNDLAALQTQAGKQDERIADFQKRITELESLNLKDISQYSRWELIKAFFRR